ncbi:hypothetical protein CK203_104628 [Vitis vinifera]|uniref:Integrase catalytic domain-containing protein n=1 Tax=Vitis vinifera TaxID=29760 RepID=A0A438DP86_VITVI|nr:hypothetical protein CK203_104628 [Vitis vinifera]
MEQAKSCPTLAIMGLQLSSSTGPKLNNEKFIDHGLHIQSASGFSLTSFSDADWVKCVDDPSLTTINHRKTSPNIDKSTFKCTHCNKTDPTSLDIPQFQSNDSWYDQENNEESRKKDSKKTSTATVAEIKTEANVAEKAFALVAATDYGDRFHPLDLPHKKLFPQPMDIQTRQTIVVVLSGGKLYYLDLQSKDSNKLQQALMADDLRGRRKSLKFGYGIDVWDMLPLNDLVMFYETKDEVNLLFQNFHKMIETQYNAKIRVLRNDNGGEYQSFDLQKYLEGYGIIHQTTCSNTPQKMESLNGKIGTC